MHPLCNDEEKQINQAALRYTCCPSRPGLTGPMEMSRSGGALLARMKDMGGFDLNLLDILMPRPNGMAANRRLRAMGKDGCPANANGARHTLLEDLQHA